MLIPNNECLFIGIDIQSCFARSAPNSNAVISRIALLRGAIAHNGSQSCQVFQQMPAPPAYLAGAGLRREIANLEARHKLLFSPVPDEPTYDKRETWADNAAFKKMVAERRPRLIVGYGFFTNACVPSVVMQAARLSPGSIGLVVSDCGQTQRESLPGNTTISCLREELQISERGVDCMKLDGLPCRPDATSRVDKVLARACG